ncbi:hypothetical protein F511_22249 [Dorcoceras hygrometricum]|uniref:Uncharacterized protein n=1 Tax=Dorcoceras hygrometricum TaxID=472368 RepID=A0A2Z7BXB4_9LAMI|nr:hypothetical protein F511_22249 [Dorcoceras hygrometricum]
MDSRRFRWFFCSCEVALDSSREALPLYTSFRSCNWLVEEREVAAVRVLRRPGCEGERRYLTLISLLGSLATMRRVVNYLSSWARQQQVELFDASGFGYDVVLSFIPADNRYVDVSITVESCVDNVDFTVREEDATSFELVATPRIDVAAGCEGERRYLTLISLLGSLATMRRVVNYLSSWARQQQVELFDASGNPGFTAGRGFNPAGGAPGGG